MDRTDAFGRALLDWVRGGTDPEIVERDDGFIEIGAGPEVYLASFEDWPAPERRAMRYVRGRVVDIGCGAGRVSLHLQERGFDVTGIDTSPLAVRASRARGARRVWRLPIDHLTSGVGSFDTLVLFGNNFGIFGSPQRLRALMTEWSHWTPNGARILAESTNPYHDGPPLDRGYRRLNREHARMAGQVRLRVRYRDWATPFFEWLFVSPTEMRRLLRGTGWHARRFLGPTMRGTYVAILEKTSIGRPVRGTAQRLSSASSA
jgi:SAM-dependent methyltransferase